MVVDGDRLVGLLSLSDLLKFIALKVELEDDGSASSDTLPRQEWTSPAATEASRGILHLAAVSWSFMTACKLMNPKKTT